MLNALKKSFNQTTTANGAVAYKSSESALLDLFALGGAYRKRDKNGVVELFAKAFEEDPLLALKCLFFIRDVRGGLGERRFFRICLEYLAKKYPEVIDANIWLVPEYGRWDDLWPLLFHSNTRDMVLNVIDMQLDWDLKSQYPSLLAKWLPSECTKNHQKKLLAKIIIKELFQSASDYRRIIADLRQRLNIVERLMSKNKWDQIHYDKIPSRAGFRYRNAFLERDGARYIAFLEAVKAGQKKLHTGTLFPYEIVQKALKLDVLDAPQLEIDSLDNYWVNLPDYVGNDPENSICVVDTSGSMTGRPLEVALSLGLYFAERAKGPYRNHFITFSHRPELVEITGNNIVEKVDRMSQADWDGNTNIERVFLKILDTAIQYNVSPEDMIQKVYIISDMQFDYCSYGEDVHIFENLRELYRNHGYQLPQLVFWQVNAFKTNVQFTKDARNIQMVSGFTPILFQFLINRTCTPYELMVNVLNTDRYKDIIISIDTKAKMKKPDK